MPPACLRTVLLLLLGLAVAACGPLPRPFQSTPAEKSDNGLLELPQGRGVYVLGVDGRRGAPAQAAAAELRALGLPAGTALANEGSYALAGFSEVEDRPGPDENVAIQWVLSAPDGRILQNTNSTLSLPDGLWRTGDAAALRAHLHPAMRDIAATIMPDRPSANRAVSGSAGAGLAIVKVTAPGDGPESLSAAMEKALAAEGLPVRREAGEDDLRIEGEVTVVPQGGGLERVAIVWTVRRPEDSEPLGTVRQENTVPAGLLSGPWGGNAQVVAQAAVPGLVDLLRKTGRGSTE
ncbi:MAG: hypothetical protein R3316_01415 [Rhodovibrionaceae bacterium]|nr:hypothetical protein [Rhodovibrionaceae bacterium]